MGGEGSMANAIKSLRWNRSQIKGATKRSWKDWKTMKTRVARNKLKKHPELTEEARAKIRREIQLEMRKLFIVRLIGTVVLLAIAFLAVYYVIQKIVDQLPA